MQRLFPLRAKIAIGIVVVIVTAASLNVFYHTTRGPYNHTQVARPIVIELFRHIYGARNTNTINAFVTFDGQVFSVTDLPPLSRTPS